MADQWKVSYIIIAHLHTFGNINLNRFIACLRCWSLWYSSGGHLYFMSRTTQFPPNLWHSSEFKPWWKFLSCYCFLSVMGAINSVLNGWSWETYRIRHGLPIRRKMVTRGMYLVSFSFCLATEKLPKFTKGCIHFLW